jgi:uncharacterized repeat protein (TIGR01451 family)
MKVKVLLVMSIVAMALFIQGCECPAPKQACAPKDPCAKPPVAISGHAYPLAGAIILEKSAPQEVIANASFEYNIKLTNTLDRKLTNVMVFDKLPLNMRIQTSSPSVDKMQENRAQWMIGSLEANASEMIAITAIASGTGKMTSCASVTYDTPICAQIKVIAHELALLKSAPDESLSCDRIPVSYIVTNTGDRAACGIEIKDQLPQGLLTAEGEEEVTFKLASLAPEESHEFQIMLDASRTGDFASQAIATSNEGGRALSNMPNTSVSEPILQISQSSPSMDFIDRPVTFEFTVSNKGNGIAKDTVITASLPAGISFESSSDGGQYTQSSPGQVTWRIGEIQPNSSKVVRMTVSSQNTGALISNATVAAHCAQSVETTAKTIIEGIPAVLLEVIDISDPVRVGENDTYVITVENQGSASISNLRVMCEMEKEMSYVSSTGPSKGMVAGRKIEFEPLSQLAPKDRAIWRVTVKAIGVGDLRFKTAIKSDQFERVVSETEATTFYE